MSDEIDQKKAAWESVCQDINEFMNVVGCPSLAVLGAERAEARHHLAEAIEKSKDKSIVAFGHYPLLGASEKCEPSRNHSGKR
ncbi:hypothetical protein [Methanothrix sp.]|uniref:hypothetical protein n=1 Tax=Methanothrix sp. TaxID=90426 RepID=UPI0032977BA0